MKNGLLKLSVFRRRRAACKIVAAISAFAMLTVASLPSFAGTKYLGGNAELEELHRVTLTSSDADALAFGSSAAVGVLDWSKFNIGSTQSMTFNGDSTTFFNLVNGAAGKSQIDGLINGNGSVWVINPSGVAFGSTAVVDVGGLFAAAAGSLENAAALRDGTATAPVFSTFISTEDVSGDAIGKVTVDAAAKFSADQVALLGKSVNVAGAGLDVADGFKNVNQLTIGAANKLVVDEVGGGKISVNIADFIDDDTVFEADTSLGSVVLGDIDAGGSSSKEGNITVVAEGSIGVQGAVKAEGDIVFKSLASSSASAPVIARKQMSVASGKLLQGKSASATAAGCVSVGGDIEAVDGNVTLESLSEDVVVNGTVTLATGNSLTLSGATEVSGSGSIKAAGSSVEVASSAGAINLTGAVLAKDATFAAADDKAVSVANEGNDFTGTVEASGASVTLKDANGIALGAVTATGDLTVTAGGDVTQSAAATVSGATTVTATGFDVTLGNADNDFTGTVEASGASVTLVDANDLALGDVTASAGNVSVAWGGKLTVATDKEVKATGGNISLVASDDAATIGDSTNESDFNGNITVATSGKELVVKTGAGGIVRGVVTSPTKATLETKSGELKLTNTGNLIDGTVDIRGTVDIVSTGTYSYSGVTGDAEGNAGLNAHGADMTISGMTFTGVTGEFAVEGAKDLTVNQDITAGTVNLEAAEDVTINNDITANSGSVSISGSTVTTGASKTIKAKDGISITIADDTTVTMAGSYVADSDSDGTGNLTVVAANPTKSASIDQTGGSISAANITATKITQSGGAKMTATGTITADIEQNGCETDAPTIVGNVTMTKDTSRVTTGLITGDVDLQDGILRAKNDVHDYTDLTIDGAFTQSGGTVKDVGILEFKNGAVSQTGTGDKSIVANTLKLTGAGAVDLSSTGNKFASVEGTAVSLSVADSKDGIVLGNLTTTGSLAVNAFDGGDSTKGTITQSGVVVVGGTTTLKATDDITLNNSNNDFASVGATGKGVTIQDKNAVALDTVTASSLKVTAGGAVTQVSGKTVTVSGLTDVTADDGSAKQAITLSNTGNDFGSVKADGAAVEVTDKNAVALDTVTASSLKVTAGGAVTQVSGKTVTVSGLTDVTVAAGSDVKLDNVNNELATVSVVGAGGKAKDVEIVDKDTAANGLVVADVGAKNLTVNAGGAVSQAPSTAIVVTDDTDVTAVGSITLDSTDNDFNNVKKASGASVTLKDLNDITLTSVTATAGDVNVTVGSGTITATAVSAVKSSTTDGNVTLTTTTLGDVLVDSVTADNTVTVNSVGKIEEVGTGDAVIDIAAPTIVLNAASNIGKATTLETAGTAISADVTGDGTIDIDNAKAAATTVNSLTVAGTGDVKFSQAGGGALTVTLATTADGDIDIDVADAALTAKAVTAGGAGQNVTLTTTTSTAATYDVAVDNVSATGSGAKITVNSSGAIEEDGSDAAADLAAVELDLNAATGIGAAGAIETAATSIAADTTNGNIDLDNASAAATTVSSLTTGTGDMLFSQAGGGALTVTLATTADGDIGIDVADAALTAKTVTAGGAGQNVTLATTTSTAAKYDVAVDDVSATGTGAKVTVNSSGAIEEDGSDAAADIAAPTVTLNAATGIGAAATLETSATTISATVAGGNIDIDNASASAATATLKNTGAGNILFTQSGANLNVASATAANGNIAIDVEGAGDMNVTTVTVGGANNTISLSTDDGDIAVNGAVTATAPASAGGAVTIAAGTGATPVKGTVTVSGTGTVTSDDDVNIDANVNVMVNGAVTAGSDANVDAGNNVLVNATTVNAANDVNVDAGNNVVVDNGATVTATTGDVLVGAAAPGSSIGGGFTADNGATVTATAGSVKVYATGAVVVQDAAATAASTAGTTALSTGAGSNGNVVLDAASVTVDNASVTADGAADVDAATGNVLVDNGAAVAANGAGVSIDAAAGNVTVDHASNVSGKTGVAVNTTVAGGNVTFNNGATVTATTSGDVAVGTAGTHIGGGFTADNGATVTATAGSVKVYATGAVVVQDAAATAATVAGTTALSTGVGSNGNVVVDAGSVTVDNASVTADGAVDVDGFAGVDVRNSATVRAVNGNVTIDATDPSVLAGSDVTIGSGAPGDTSSVIAGTDASIGSVNGSITVADNASVEANDNVNVSAGKDVNVDGQVTANADSTAGASGDDAIVVAGNDVAFGANGNVKGENVSIAADNDIVTGSAAMPASKGYIPQNLAYHADVTAAGTADLSAGGSIGGASIAGSDKYVGVDAASVTAKAGINASIAGAGSSEITVDPLGITAGVKASLYNVSTVNPNGTVKANEVVVTSKSYKGGIVGVNTSTITANNLKGGANPLLAIFETKGGSKDPKVTNLPNNTIVFVDGRLSGGDMQTINKLGAIEAFPVQTPELKSEQGVFGNPTFLHDELDVANPLAVGAIDFILLEVPRLTLSSDFPLEVDSDVSANGLKPTTSYWFGQTAKDQDESTDEAESSSGV